MKEENIISLSKIPYDESFTEAMIMGQTIIEHNNNEIISSQIWGESFLQELPDIAFYFNFPWDIISKIKKRIN
jgi:hypothetical protein